MHTLVPSIAVIALSSLGLAGCATTSAAPPDPTPTPAADAAVSVENCGTTVAFDVAPQRVVTIKSSTTETMLALGLGERIVGTAFQDGPVPQRWAAAAASLPSIADQVPSEEVVLETQPDLVYAGWESNFSADGAGERPELASLGVNTYVSPAACQSSGQPARLSFDDIFGEIEEVAAIFRVDATPLVDSQRAAIAAIVPSGNGRSALWYSSGADTPYVGAGIGAPQLVLDAVGLTNIAAHVPSSWAPYSWESVVDADPYYIVLVDATWNSVAKKIGILESNPATATLDAVRNQRYLTIPFAASEAGVRSVEAAASIAKQITELDG